MRPVIRTTMMLALPVVAATWARAQEITFTASVDRTSIAVGDHLKLTLQLTNGQGSFSNPDLGGLVVVNGPFESSNFQFINGRMSSSVSRTFVLTASAPGEYTIGPAQARVGGGTIQTDPIKIHVEKGSGTTGGNDRALEQAQRADQNLFATISLSRARAYVGEQVIATYTLYSRYSNLELSNYNLPTLTGFWSEDIDLGNKGWEDKLQVINGLQYRVAVLKKQLLFPQKSGMLKIEPMDLTCLVDRSFFSRGTRIDVRSATAELRVMDLPAGGPPDFNGAVGQLDLDVKADKTELPANDAIDLTVRVSGRSNLKLLDAPSINFPGDFETYDPKVNDRISITGGGMSGSREFQYLVIPRHEGRYVVPPITFSYFDPQQGGYRTLRSDTLTFTVGKGAGGQAATLTRPSRTDVQALDRDIRTIRVGDLELREKDRFLFGSWAYITGIGAPALAFLLLLAWHRRRAHALADVSGRRRRAADRVARHRLKAAAAALNGNDRAAFHDAIGRALEGYFADKFDLGVAEVNAERIGEKLGALEGGEIARRFMVQLDRASMARFAPVEDAPRKDAYDDAVALIGRIEELLKA